MVNYDQDLGNGEILTLPLNMAHMIGGMNIDQLRNLGEGESAPVQLQVNGAQATGDQSGGILFIYTVHNT